LRGRAAPRREETMRQDEQHRCDQEDVDGAREGHSPGHGHCPDEGKDRAESEQHSSSMAALGPELVTAALIAALLFAQC